MVSLLIFISQIAYAAPSHTVQMVKGSVYEGTKKLAKGSKIAPDAKIEAKDASVVFVKLGTSHMLVRFSGPGSFVVHDTDNKDVLELYQGTARIKSTSKGKENFSIKSNTAVVGVRGTDFFFTFQPLLAEAEIVVFKGTVEMTSVVDATDTKAIPEGHWGGIGGRYGKTIGDLIQLPPDILKHFDKNLSWL